MAWYDAQKETIEMVAISSVVPLIPNMNVGENERLSFHTVSTANGVMCVESVLVKMRVSQPGILLPLRWASHKS